LMQDMDEAANAHYQQFETIIKILTPYVGEVRGKAILDAGCGRLYPTALLLNSLGNYVVGIDIIHIGVNVPFLTKLRGELQNGPVSIARSLLYGILLKNRRFYRRLSKLTGFPLTTRRLVIRQMSVEQMSFPDKLFDIVVSIAVFEHVKNVVQAVCELSRVLKPGGVAYITIHLFTSLSGGHSFDWADPGKVAPWDHLRQRWQSAPVYLNRLREHEYHSLFQERFEILEVLDIGNGEGKDLLTPEIRNELSDYSEEELLKKGITIIARKRDE